MLLESSSTNKQYLQHWQHQQAPKVLHLCQKPPERMRANPRQKSEAHLSLALILGLHPGQHSAETPHLHAVWLRPQSLDPIATILCQSKNFVDAGQPRARLFSLRHFEPSSEHLDWCEPAMLRSEVTLLSLAGFNVGSVAGSQVCCMCRVNVA